MTTAGNTKGATFVKETNVNPYSPHITRSVPEPRTRKKQKLRKAPDEAESHQGGETKTFGVNSSFSTEYTPRKRSSKHLDEVESMTIGHDDIKNTVPAFAPTGNFASWDDFEQQFDAYKRKNKLKFHVRSSEKTELYNITHQHKILTQFKYSHKIYRCTHGVTQPSRSKGHRNRKSRFCTCQARLTAIINRVSGNQYGIVIRNQVKQSS
ncbi:Hypothetical protein PHPALM_12833 [Phytophthora palmivora]|uniref:ZSWIM3 N-terminal domain-containing protein n=1 Tax=Phytophthora palmivora TaxID=4796 RepID=A0A2P4XYQ6_9STRA|nr:Hypothetical protein PHPALM_12833 [Phytophthora palmivora]